MSEHAHELANRFQRRTYAELVFEHQRRMDEGGLSGETLRLLKEIRPHVRQHADEVYEHFLSLPKARADFFDGRTGVKLSEIAHTVKNHYLSRHGTLIKGDEAIALAQVITLNYARLCHLNTSFKDHIGATQGRGLFKRIFR